MSIDNIKEKLNNLKLDKSEQSDDVRLDMATTMICRLAIEGYLENDANKSQLAATMLHTIAYTKMRSVKDMYEMIGNMVHMLIALYKVENPTDFLKYMQVHQDSVTTSSDDYRNRLIPELTVYANNIKADKEKGGDAE